MLLHCRVRDLLAGFGMWKMWKKQVSLIGDKTGETQWKILLLKHESFSVPGWPAVFPSPHPLNHGLNCTFMVSAFHWGEM